MDCDDCLADEYIRNRHLLIYSVCNSVITSSVVMFKYMQRNPDSASNRLFPDYYNTIMKLHKAKTDCFIFLSRGTTESEKDDFIKYDLDTELKRMKERME